MKFRCYNAFPEKNRFSPDFAFEGNGVRFFYTYIRKNASTSFKKLFQELYPGACPGEVPSIDCMMERARVTGLTVEEVDERFDIKLFVYRDPVERVFSVFKNKLIQKDGAEDFLRRLSGVVSRCVDSLTFDDFVNEYVSLLKTRRWKEVDGHLYPQIWHLLPISYNKVIPLESVHGEMSNILPQDLCDRVFFAPVNSTSNGDNFLEDCGPETTVAEYARHYETHQSLPVMRSVLTESTEQKLRAIYSDDYAMIAQTVACSEFEENQPVPLDAALSSSLRQQAQSSKFILQFGVSEATFEVLRSLRASGGGRLICIVSSDDLLDAFCRRIEIEQLSSWLTLVPTVLVEWPYCSGGGVKWFSETVLDALPELDFVIVDVLTRQERPNNVYPAFPSIADRLSLGSELWVLGADDPKNHKVVNQWCADFAVSTELSADGRVIRVRV